MIAFLVKVRVKTVFSVFNPIAVEPMELCCLKTVLDRLNVENYLIDDLFRLKAPKGVVPDLILLNGYNVAEAEMIRQAGCYKADYPHAKIAVGGVHAQVNPEAFHVDSVDYVVHSQSLDKFTMLIEKITGDTGEAVLMDGIDTHFPHGEGEGEGWYKGKKTASMEREHLLADRSFFEQNSASLHYLEKRNVALIKGSIGCPFTCAYCYCKELNQGIFIGADYHRMAAEIENIPADYFWIVDDVLFSTRSEALEFIECIKKRKITTKFIVYLRADFILREKDLLKSLKEIGITEVIVGFESTENKELEEYEKTTDALDYPAVISLLKENGIDLTALFMVKPDYGFENFRRLNKFIRDNQIQVFTISILTPVKGTGEYEQTKDQFITRNPEKFDFLHLVVKPRLPRFLFYALFYGIQLRLLKSGRIWRYILRK